MAVDVLLKLFGVGLGILLLVGVVLVVGSYIFLPAIVEGLFAREIQDRLEPGSVPEVELEGEPSPGILVRRFGSGRVVLEEVDFEGVRSDRTVIDLDPFDLDLLASISGGSFQSEEPLSGKLRMELSEEEVTRLANSGNQGVAVQGVRLEPGEMFVDVEARVMGIRVPVSVAGNLELEGETLVFGPREISAFGSALPGGLTDRLVSRSGFEYPLGDLPYDTEVSGVRVEEGKVVVEGRIGRIPVGKAGG
ncbi:MAG: DUF2993 domain-containing protein [Rubrobacteraceae bacterium]